MKRHHFHLAVGCLFGVAALAAAITGVWMAALYFVAALVVAAGRWRMAKFETFKKKNSIKLDIRRPPCMEVKGEAEKGFSEINSATTGKEDTHE